MSSTYWFSVLILVSSSLNFSDANPAFKPLKIVGGNTTDPNDYKYVVGINCDHRACKCTGAIIHELFVVSAAHCFVDQPERSFRILAGTNDISDYQRPGRVERDVVAIYVPVGYQLTSSYADDIAVLRLNESLKLEENNLQRLRLPARPKNSTYKVNRAVLLGFGSAKITIVENEDGQLSEITKSNYLLHSANVEVLPLSQCYNLFVTRSNICGRVIKDESTMEYGGCNGDSGGPLVFKYQVLLGVFMNNPFGCDERVRYAVYTRVKSHVNFIDKAVKNIRSGIVKQIY